MRNVCHDHSRDRCHPLFPLFSVIVTHHTVFCFYEKITTNLFLVITFCPNMTCGSIINDIRMKMVKWQQAGMKNGRLRVRCPKDPQPHKVVAGFNSVKGEYNMSNR